MIIDLQNRTHASSREVSESVGMGYRTLLRWRRRVSGGKPPLTPPGPKKTGPLPLDEVRREIEALRHGAKRSRGICALQVRYQPSSPAGACRVVAFEERTRRNLARRQVSKQVTWREPNLAWAIDATEPGKDQQGQRLYVHAVQDLCTRYRFAPLVAVEPRARPSPRIWSSSSENTGRRSS